MSIPTTNAKGLYSVKWVNATYTGPIFTIRRSSDNVTSDFYVSGDGVSIGTAASGTGTSLTSWLNGATAYITKWWDQSSLGNHATQTTNANQPVFNTTSKYVQFTASSSQFFNLPNNTVPSGNSNYTVTLKHGIINNTGTTGPNSGGFLGSGSTSTVVFNSVNSFSVGTNSSSNYSNYWFLPDFNNKGTYAANSTLTWKYDGSNRYLYTNNVLTTSAASSGRASGTTNNFIGIGDIINNNYLDGQLYFVHIYSSALDDATRILVESINTIGSAPTITSITNSNTSSINVYFTSGIGGNPIPTTYYYSLNGGSTYTNANTTTSPIVINGLNVSTNYNVALIANNLAGNTVASNIVTVSIVYPCFLEGSKILRMNPETDQDEYVAIETLRCGDLIKTSRNGYKAIFYIGRKTLPNPATDIDPRNRLYRFPKSIHKDMIDDLCITGEHCILHEKVEPELMEKVREHMGDVYITEYMIRVPACLDNRAEPYTNKTPATIWHIALENHNIYHNYGIYANGLLVESCSIQYLTELSNMELM